MSALSRLFLLLDIVLVLTVTAEVGVRLVLYIGKRLGFDVTTPKSNSCETQTLIT